MDNLFSGSKPRIIGATVYALNRTHGLAPARPAGDPEIVVRVVNSYYGLIQTAEGNLYCNGDFGIARLAKAEVTEPAEVTATH